MCERAEHVQSLVFYALLIIETCILYTPAHIGVLMFVLPVKKVKTVANCL